MDNHVGVDGYPNKVKGITQDSNVHNDEMFG